MPKLSSARRDARRDHILRAAALCFAREGFHRTTIADVRREANVSTGAIYTYFANKESIIRAMLEQARHERRAQLGESNAPATDALPQALVLLDWVRAIFGEHGQHAARVDVNLWAEAVRSPRVAKIARAALSEASQAVSAVVEQRMRTLQPDSRVDAAALASVLVSIFLGLEVQTAVGVGVDADAVVRVLAALFGAHAAPAAAPRSHIQKRSKKRARKA